jgi:hypothetical protein
MCCGELSVRGPSSYFATRGSVPHFPSVASRNALRVRPQHPECRVQLVDSLVLMISLNETTACPPLSWSLPLHLIRQLQDLINATDTLLSQITIDSRQQGGQDGDPAAKEAFRSSVDLLSVAITYQRISNLIVTSVCAPLTFPRRSQSLSLSLS